MSVLNKVSSCICLCNNDNNSYFVERGGYYNFGAEEFWSFGDDWYSTFDFKKVEAWVDLEELVKDFERSVTDIK